MVAIGRTSAFPTSPCPDFDSHNLGARGWVDASHDTRKISETVLPTGSRSVASRSVVVVATHDMARFVPNRCHTPGLRDSDMDCPLFGIALRARLCMNSPTLCARGIDFRRASMPTRKFPERHAFSFNLVLWKTSTRTHCLPPNELNNGKEGLHGYRTQESKSKI